MHVFCTCGDVIVSYSKNILTTTPSLPLLSSSVRPGGPSIHVIPLEAI